MAPIPESAYKIQAMQQAFSQARLEQWSNDVVWHWQWWCLVAIFLLPWVAWWWLVDKRRLTQICLLGMFVLATAVWMDEIGTELGLWFYPYKIMPFYPQLVPINYSVLPITYMLAYQYTPRWTQYLRMMLVISALYAWLAEPVLQALGIYQMLNWKLWYSFAIYMVIAVSHRWLLERVLAITGRGR